MIHINRFLDRISSAEAKKLKQVSMSLSDAKGLHTDITKLLLHLQDTADKSKVDQQIEMVELTGRKW